MALALESVRENLLSGRDGGTEQVDSSREAAAFISPARKRRVKWENAYSPFRDDTGSGAHSKGRATGSNGAHGHS